MGRLRLLGLALIAVFAISALAASAAFAEEKTKFLPEATSTNPISFLLDQEGTGKLELAGGSKVECEGAHGTGDATSANYGTISILFTKCKGPLGTTCTSTGAGSGLIAFSGEFHFLLAIREGKLVGAIVGLFGQVVFTCSVSIISEKVTVEAGCLAGEVDEGELNKLVSSFYILYHESKGVPAITEILPVEAKELSKCTTDAVIGSGKAEESGLEGHFKVDTFEQGGSSITVLLMNPEGL